MDLLVGLIWVNRLVGSCTRELVKCTDPAGVTALAEVEFENDCEGV